MSGSLKKSLTFATQDELNLKCATKPTKLIKCGHSQNVMKCASVVPQTHSVDLKQGAINITVPLQRKLKPILKPFSKPLLKPVVKSIPKPIIKPIKKSVQKPIKKPIEKPVVKPLVIEQGDIRLTSAYRQRRSFLEALNASIERELQAVDAQAKAAKKEPKIKKIKSQSSVALARKKYAYLSRCNLKSSSVITNNSTKKKTKDSEHKTQINCESYKGVARYAETVKLLESMKSTNNNLKLKGVKGKDKPKLDPVAAHAIRLLKRTKVKLSISDLRKGLNPQELYKLQVPEPKTMIEELCSKCNLICFNQPREMMPLIVLDLDETLCDFFSEIGGACFRARRPHLEYFLEAVYLFYDIAIWSATNMESIMLKLNYLNMINNAKAKYNITFCLDVTSTIITHIPGVGRSITKPLIIIWELYPEYNVKNTLMIDDKPNNFYFNPHNGVTITEYKHNGAGNDIELMQLGQYLYKIADLDVDLSKINHSLWKERVNAILR